MRQLSAMLMVCAALSGCVAEAPTEHYADPTSLATPTESDGIVAWIVSPALTKQLANATPEIVLGAYTKGEAKPLELQIGRLEKGESGDDEIVHLRPAARSGDPG